MTYQPAPSLVRAYENLARVDTAMDRTALARICAMPESQFKSSFGMDKTLVHQAKPANYYLHQDNRSDILAVAHLDTVVRHDQRPATFCETADGPVIYSGALDDRLGAYTILHLLPTLGISVDVLCTTGEERGMSTASFFETDKSYKWIIEFDRGGTDVVMYQYDDYATSELVRATGARCGKGSYSDIAYLDHLGVKAFNWGVGYHDYHGPRSHAFLDDYTLMVARFMTLHQDNKDTHLPHVPYVRPATTYMTSGEYRTRLKRDWWKGSEWDDYEPKVIGTPKAITTGKTYKSASDFIDGGDKSELVTDQSVLSKVTDPFFTENDLTEEELAIYFRLLADDDRTDNPYIWSDSSD